MEQTTRSNADARIISKYELSEDYNLDNVYKSYSRNKSLAWDYCKNLMEKYNGHGLKVISHNLNMFTAGFIYESGDDEYLMYITKSADSPIKLYTSYRSFSFSFFLSSLFLHIFFLIFDELFYDSQDKEELDLLDALSLHYHKFYDEH